MKNCNLIHLSLAEMTEYFEHFPKNLTYRQLCVFIEWFNLSFQPEEENKIYFQNCNTHYFNYVNAYYKGSHHFLTAKNFSTILHIALRKIELKQIYRIDNPNGSIQGPPDYSPLKYYMRKRDAKSFYYFNFKLKDLKLQTIKDKEED